MLLFALFNLCCVIWLDNRLVEHCQRPTEAQIISGILLQKRRFFTLEEYGSSKMILKGGFVIRAKWQPLTHSRNGMPAGAGMTVLNRLIK